MKTLNVTFEDEEYDLLVSRKEKDMTWRQFILELVPKNDKDRKWWK